MSEVSGRVLCDEREASCRCREAAGTFEPVSAPVGMARMILGLPPAVPGIRFDEEW